MAGSSTSGGQGVYGTLGVPESGNTPGARDSCVGWNDSDGNFWMFGGYGYDSSGKPGYLNDLWEFSVATNEWTWMGGSSTANSPAVYGTLGIADVGNIPGARDSSIGWSQSGGNLWLFGGYKYDSLGASGLLNDLWEVGLVEPPPVFAPAGETYTGTLSVTITANPAATVYYTTDGTQPTVASAKYGGPFHCCGVPRR